MKRRQEGGEEEEKMGTEKRGKVAGALEEKAADT